MAKATSQQWNVAIANYRRTAAEFRQSAAIWPEGNWRRGADLRIAAKADESADRLERLRDQAISVEAA